MRAIIIIVLSACILMWLAEHFKFQSKCFSVEEICVSSPKEACENYSNNINL